MTRQTTWRPAPAGSSTHTTRRGRSFGHAAFRLPVWRRLAEVADFSSRSREGALRPAAPRLSARQRGASRRWTIPASKTGLSWYLERINDAALLNAEQEKRLARRIREHADPVAREQMIHANLRLVVNIAKQYSNRGMTLADLVAEGNLGLLRAVEEFDPDAGVRFSTYAAWWIKQAIKRAMINAGQPIHIPAYMVEQIGHWRRAARELEARLGHPPTVEEMARHMKIPLKKAGIIHQALMAVHAPTQMAGEEAAALGEMLADHNTPQPEQVLEPSDAPIVRQLLHQLDERQRTILTLRYGLDGYDGPQRTLKEVGAMIGLTRERVRQLEKEALAKLHELLEDIW